MIHYTYLRTFTASGCSQGRLLGNAWQGKPFAVQTDNKHTLQKSAFEEAKISRSRVGGGWRWGGRLCKHGLLKSREVS